MDQPWQAAGHSFEGTGACQFDQVLAQLGLLRQVGVPVVPGSVSRFTRPGLKCRISKAIARPERTRPAPEQAPAAPNLCWYPIRYVGDGDIRSIGRASRSGAGRVPPRTARQAATAAGYGQPRFSCSHRRCYLISGLRSLKAEVPAIASHSNTTISVVTTRAPASRSRTIATA